MTYFNGEQRVSIRYPSGWRTDEAEQEVLVLEEVMVLEEVLVVAEVAGEVVTNGGRRRNVYIHHLILPMSKDIVQYNFL